MKIKYIPSKDPRSEKFNELIENKFSFMLNEKEPDLILVSGGDGALLHKIQDYNHLQLPFFGRAAGTLNFLMNDFDDPEEILSKLIDDKLAIDIIETNSICIQIKKRGENSYSNLGYAVNEVILGSNVMGFHYFNIVAPKQGFDNFAIKGTGISISTSLGSTGYNFNLGGPILPLDSKYWIIKGIVTDKYLEDIIEIHNFVIEIVDLREPTYIFKDGIKAKATLDTGDKIKLSLGQTIKLAFFDLENFRKKRLKIASRFRKE